MTIRETIQKQPIVSILVAIVVGAFSFFFILRDTRSPKATISTRAFYSTDEGVTSFIDELDHLPPFDHDGKPAYRVWMFTCDGGKTKFPGYLERYTPQAKARLESPTEKAKAEQTHVPLIPALADSEVKRPGAENQWVSRANTIQAAQITEIRCPTGGELEVVLP